MATNIKHGGGRKQDCIWMEFERSFIPGIAGVKAKCKSCSKEMTGIVSRMKKHIVQCKDLNDQALLPSKFSLKSLVSSITPPEVKLPEIPLAKKLKASASISNFVIKTSPQAKHNFDLQVARMVYATNSSFSLVEHKEFKKLCELLRPGYSPPSRKIIASTLLNEVHQEAYAMCKEKLHGKTVSMELDGWSNVHNEPVVCCSVTTSDGDTYLTSTIDTQENRHTADNLEEIAEAAIKKAEGEFGCRVRSFVTDNAANMKKMRSQLGASLPVITYPCSAHVVDRLAKDVDTCDVKSKVVKIAKYFRNHHIPNAWYKIEGGKELSLPIDVRWNSVADCLQAYIDNWAILVKVVESHRAAIDSAICDDVLDISLKRRAEDYLSRMKPIAIALDKLQSDKCLISDAVVIWKELQEKFEDRSIIDHFKFDARISTALTPAHYLAYHLDPRYHDSNLLSIEEIQKGMNFLSEHHSPALSSVLKYRAKFSPHEAYMFNPELLKDMTPLVWWQSQTLQLEPAILSLVEQLHSARASSAGIERIFSTFGFVHSKIRNRLGTTKAAKLVFLFKLLNM